jgi:predicted RNA binding protein YcfA (HicA-like mRNA interferase family)
MSKWEKTLAAMAIDSRPVGYTYAEAAAVLRGLGFELARGARGSHRKWRRKSAGGVTIVVGLVEGSDPLKAYLVRDMISQLRTGGLVT